MLQLKLMDFNQEYQRDMESGMGFLIKTEKGITKDEKRDPDGIYSTRYGDSVDDENEYSKYTCQCGALKGRFYEGTECDQCHTKVTHNYTDIRKTGWLVMDGYELINPLFYLYIAKIIGNTRLQDIIKFNKDIDKDGNFIDDPEERIKNPYINIGMLEFRERFDEILDYFYYQRKEKERKTDLYEFIRENRELVFISKYPIYSTVLRPIMILNKNVMYSDINKKLTLLAASILNLNKNKNKIDRKLIRILPNLFQAQTILNDIFVMNINEIGGKFGHIRNNLLGENNK